MTREPEAVKAFRDTWELISTPVCYLSDVCCRTRASCSPRPAGFVQIGDEKHTSSLRHWTRCLGRDNFVAQINFKNALTARAKRGCSQRLRLSSCSLPIEDRLNSA